MSEAEDQLAEYGVPVNAVRGLLLDELTKLAQNAATHSRAIDARPGMRDNLQNVDAFLASNPEIARRVQNVAAHDIEAGTEMAWTYFQNSPGARRGSPPAPSYGSVSTPPGSVSFGRVGIHAGDAERESRDAYIKRRLRESIKHPDFGDEVPRY